MINYLKEDVILSNIAHIVEKHISDEHNITLIIDPSMGEFDGKYENGVLSAGSYSQLLDVAGRFLRNPNMENGTFHSNKEVCGLYFASHNHNYYEVTPVEEICEDIERFALWGANSINVWFDMFYFQNMEEGKELVGRLTSIIKFAKSIGLKTVLTTLSNESFPNSPKELRADWTSGHDGYIHELNAHYHVEICPTTDGGLDKILEYRRQYLEAFRDAEPDFVSIGAYDQGGCSCKDCAPWGCNGFLKCSEALIPLYREFWPNVEFILSAWHIGLFMEDQYVEMDGINEAFKDGRLKEIKYVLAEPGHQPYAFEKKMLRPMIGFPEISMHGALPWGGFGGNPFPNLLQSIWNEHGDKIEGGYPYCEGFYEEINKVVMLRLYRDGQDASKTVREYLEYEFDLSGEMLEKAYNAVMDMEETLPRSFELGHQYPIEAPEKIPAIEKAIIEVDASLPDHIRNGKRWQLIYLRAVIDGELYRNDFKRNDKVLEYFYKIIELYHLENATFHVKPDIIKDEVFGRTLTKKELEKIAAGGDID